MEFNFSLQNVTRSKSYLVHTNIDEVEKRFLDFSVDYRLLNYFPNITVRLLFINLVNDIDSIRAIVTVDITSPTLQNNLQQFSIDILRGIEKEVELINTTIETNRLFGYIPKESNIGFQNNNACWCIYLETPDQKIEYTPLKFCAPTLDVIYNTLKKYYYEGE